MRRFAAFLLCFALALPSTSFANGSKAHHKTTSTKAPKKAPARGIPCSDGTTSHAKHTQGACSYHGGIKK